jgi:hypothetical protein
VKAPDLPKTIELTARVLYFGRGDGQGCLNTPPLNSNNQPNMVSRDHARLVHTTHDNRWVVYDTDSKVNGTLLKRRDDQTAKRVQLAQIRDGDIITCGGLFLSSLPRVRAHSGGVKPFDQILPDDNCGTSDECCCHRGARFLNLGSSGGVGQSLQDVTSEDARFHLSVLITLYSILLSISCGVSVAIGVGANCYTWSNKVRLLPADTSLIRSIL